VLERIISGFFEHIRRRPTPLLMNRLPQNLCLIISREIGDEEWNTDQLINIVEHEVSAQERASVGSHMSRVPTSAALLTGDSQPKCSYCHQGHSSSSYTVVRDVSQRRLFSRGQDSVLCA